MCSHMIKFNRKLDGVTYLLDIKELMDYLR